ncbi:MAG: glutamate-5-semialdehyde dehydrogenase [Armatimonadetes bacterium]|nr:glutamate-5-semialdehyde dehydrogenase [Armatimonadota bacterium]
MPVERTVVERAMRAKEASRVLAEASAEKRGEALVRAADLLAKRQSKVMRANAVDLEGAQRKGLSSAMVDRLTITDKRLAEMAQGLREVAEQPDPIGRVIDEWTRPNGLRISKVRVPLGVVGIIYESRPNVTVDAAGLCLKSGNAALLRGGSEAINSNLALAAVMQEACEDAGLPTSCVEMIPVTDREAVYVMARLDRYLSLIVPRGGEELIRAVAEVATVPVIKHHRGLCHVYIDATCDVPMAVKLVHNAKCQRPGVCNAVETLLVHRANAEALKAVLADLLAAGVEVRGDETVQAASNQVKPATEKDWDTEYLDLILSVRVVDSLDEALGHIAQYSSGLSEAIITDNEANTERFLREVDSACVYANASTRFTDGGQFGLGAEIGISTDKFHARGPMGAGELTSYKYVLRGEGHVRE